MSLQTKCARFHSVGTLPILGFVSEDTLLLEESYRVAFTTAKEKNSSLYPKQLSLFCLLWLISACADRLGYIIYQFL